MALIILTGWVDVEPGRRNDALDAGREPMRCTRAWPGCLDYVWSADPLAADRIYVYERWESEDALASHFAGPHYRAMRDAIGAHGIRAVEVFKYAVARQGGVYDARGVPRADFFENE